MNDIGEKIKYFRELKGLSQGDLARLVGVGQTAISNYESNRRAPNLFVLSKLCEAFNITIDFFMNHQQNEVYSSRNYLKKLLYYISLKQEENVYKMFERLIINDDLLVDIYENVIRAALYDIGRRWEEEKISVATEHYGSSVLLKLVNKLSNKEGRSIQDDVKAICITPKNEMHTIGIRFVDEYLSILGISSIYVGNNTPTKSIESIIDETGANIVMISITFGENLIEMKELIAKLSERFSNLKIVVGGQAFNSGTTYRDVGGHYFASDFESLKEIIYDIREKRDEHV